MKLLQTWQAFVSQRSAREQSGIYAAVWLMGLGLLWQIAVAPAWQVWRDSDAQLAQLAKQHADMLALQQQAKLLQSQTHLGSAQAAQALQSICLNLGEKVKCSRQAHQMTTDVKGLSPQVMAQAWAQARIQAQAVVVESHLQRQGEAWNGQWIWALPEDAP
ncbi:MAG: hypothetical protein EBR42_03700 [Betaproteobacteria bacterium]|nr:hypothetical protein [Betaproteobacteria bacterium]